jgi:hypothetical protein
VSFSSQVESRHAQTCVPAQLYRGMIEADAPVSDMIPEKDVRNQANYQWNLAGERAVALAREFGISVRRGNRLMRRILNRGQL